MQYKGRLKLPGDRGAGILVDLRLDDIFLEVSSGGEEIGRWRMDDVSIERMFSNEFSLELAGESLVFVADDALSFAYEGVVAIEDVSSRLTKKRRGHRRRRAPEEPGARPEPAVDDRASGPVEPVRVEPARAEVAFVEAPLEPVREPVIPEPAAGRVAATPEPVLAEAGAGPAPRVEPVVTMPPVPVQPPVVVPPVVVPPVEVPPVEVPPAPGAPAEEDGAAEIVPTARPVVAAIAPPGVVAPPVVVVELEEAGSFAADAAVIDLTEVGDDVEGPLATVVPLRSTDHPEPAEPSESAETQHVEPAEPSESAETQHVEPAARPVEAPPPPVADAVPAVTHPRSSLLKRRERKPAAAHEHVYEESRTIGGITRRVCSVCGHVSFLGEDVYGGWS